MVFQKVTQGLSSEQASIQVHKDLKGATAGCGPVHRIAQSLVMKIPTDCLISIAIEEAAIHTKIQETVLPLWPYFVGI